MHKYFIKTPRIVKIFFPFYVWTLPTNENAVYISFDDGPHPTITPWVLDELKKYNAFATFFCIGKNVKQFPDVYQRILDEGHAVGNHSYSHLNGWKTNEENYFDDVKKADELIHSNLFRPPYGRIKKKQAEIILTALQKDSKIIMWDVLSADFDSSFSPEKCLDHVVKNTVAGSIIVFHDSEKAFTNLKYALPKAIGYLKDEGYMLKKIEL